MSSSVHPGTVSQVLDALCNLDTTFAWLRRKYGESGCTEPCERSALFPERKIDALTFENTHNARAAVFKTAAQLPGSLEQISVAQTGMSLVLAKPWTVTMKDTVREVFDQIAQQFGPNCGWHCMVPRISG